MATYKLIDGEFTVAEAKELVANLLEYKIQYHSRQNFSDEIRSGRSNEQSLKRSEELTRTKEAFLERMALLDPEIKIVMSADIMIM